MEEKYSDTLESVFEEVLDELKQGSRDEAAILQAEAMAETNNPEEWKKIYLRIRAKKIIDERAKQKEKVAIEDRKTKERKEASRKNRTEQQDIKIWVLSVGLVLLFIGFLTIVGVPIINIFLFFLVALLFLPTISKWFR